MRILIPTLFLLIGCNPLKHYQKVANDPFRNSAERELLARASSQEFPNTISDTPTVTVHYDSTEYNELLKKIKGAALGWSGPRPLEYDSAGSDPTWALDISAYYPRDENVITGTDNRAALDAMIKAAIKPATITKTVTKEVKIRDAVWTELKENEIRQARWENERLRMDLNQANTARKNQRTMIYWISGILLFLLVIVVWKPKIPQLPKIPTL
jgi:hypothetical protein